MNHLPIKAVPGSRDFYPSLATPHYLIRKGIFKAMTRYGGRLSGKMMDFGDGSKPYGDMFTYTEYIGVDHMNEGHSHELIHVYCDESRPPRVSTVLIACFRGRFSIEKAAEKMIEISRQREMIALKGRQASQSVPERHMNKSFILHQFYAAIYNIPPQMTIINRISIFLYLFWKSTIELIYHSCHK
ncbi:hypothetical protein [Ferruginibacter sp. HRS2-29]|uniref:hypothetical protein n=1 Tax=Ferruginibacter sp. HRS2-29 TaxID=2487334 RepID=UPI0020CDD94A|nr:hypothetical protein [Ferruginibacter sp. HRS2-29]MCP9750922.1 hypothetical protein [Ferruginibacter sp. HRS2-29]